MMNPTNAKSNNRDTDKLSNCQSDTTKTIKPNCATTAKNGATPVTYWRKGDRSRTAAALAAKGGIASGPDVVVSVNILACPSLFWQGQSSLSRSRPRLN